MERYRFKPLFNNQIDHPSSPEVARVYRIGSYPVFYFFEKGSPRFYDGELKEELLFLCSYSH